MTKFEPTARCTRVLIVDDNRDVAWVLGLLLRNGGFDARIAFDASSALLVAQRFAPDVALLDIGLPDVSGYDLARQLRRLAPSRSLHLIAMTGFALDCDRAKAHVAGFDQHLTKPVTFAEIRAVIADRRRETTRSSAPPRMDA
jgi:DNA-binding response OmpR family regulator